MLITISNRITDLINRAFNFIKKNGFRATISRLKFLLKKRKNLSYKSLLDNFSQDLEMLIPNRKKKRKLLIDATAESAINKLVQLLNINEDPAQVLLLLKKHLGKNKYLQLLDDLFTLIKFVIRSSPDRIPIIQSKELPISNSQHFNKDILFVTSQTPSQNHGGGNRILNFLKILSEDNNIYLATGYSPREDDELLEYVSQYCRSLYKIPYWRFGNNQSEIHNWLNGKIMDIVHYEWPASLDNYDSEFGRLHIFTYMEAFSLRLLIDLEKTPHLSPIWLNIFSQLIHVLRKEIADTTFLTARIAVTTKDAEFLRMIYPYQEYTVLNHGVILDEFTLPDVESEPQTLVFVGNFRHSPNVDALNYFFNEVWDDVCMEIPSTKIYIVGPHLPKEIARQAINPQVIVTGGVPDVRPYIQKGTVCIAPLITGAGLRGKIIEYAALKRTFVATSIATTDLAYEDGLDYLLANNPSDFAQKIILLLKNDKLRQKMAVSAFNTTQKYYDTRRLVDFLYRLYDRLEHV